MGMKMQDLQQLDPREAKLGSTQRDVLESLRDHKYWADYDLTSWIWSNRGVTRKVMQSLVKKGVARVEREDIGHYKNVDVYYPIKGAN